MLKGMSNRLQDPDARYPWHKDFVAYANEVRIKLIRERGSQVSDNDLASHFGVSPASFNFYINGIREPSLEQLDRMADRVGPEIYALFGREARYKADGELGEILQKFPYLPAWLQRRVYDEVMGFDPDAETGAAGTGGGGAPDE